jgi:hypothetical protein
VYKRFIERIQVMKKKLYNQPQTEICSMQMGCGIMLEMSVGGGGGGGKTEMPRRGDFIE